MVPCDSKGIRRRQSEDIRRFFVGEDIQWLRQGRIEQRLVTNAFRATVFAEKWQLTAAGSDRHPIPMLSAKPFAELTLMVTVPFCEETRLKEPGFTVTEKPTAVPEKVMALDVDGLCIESPL